MLNRLKDSVKLNHIFGKKVLFIEGLPITKDKIFPFIKKHNVKKVFCLSPIDYKQSKYNKQTNQKEFEQSCKEVYTKLKEMNIQIIPHIHIKNDLKVHKKVEKKIVDTMEWFFHMGVITNEVSFGWWLECANFDKICHDLDLRVSERQLHYYDFWI